MKQKIYEHLALAIHQPLQSAIQCTAMHALACGAAELLREPAHVLQPAVAAAIRLMLYFVI